MRRAAIRAPAYAIALDDGFVVPTRWRTLARWQRALTGEAEYRLLLADAERQAARRPPHAQPLQTLARSAFATR